MKRHSYYITIAYCILYIGCIGLSSSYLQARIVRAGRTRSARTTPSKTTTQKTQPEQRALKNIHIKNALPRPVYISIASTLDQALRQPFEVIDARKTYIGSKDPAVVNHMLVSIGEKPFTGQYLDYFILQPSAQLRFEVRPNQQKLASTMSGPAVKKLLRAGFIDVPDKGFSLVFTRYTNNITQGMTEKRTILYTTEQPTSEVQTPLPTPVPPPTTTPVLTPPAPPISRPATEQIPQVTAPLPPATDVQTEPISITVPEPPSINSNVPSAPTDDEGPPLPRSQQTVDEQTSAEPISTTVPEPPSINSNVPPAPTDDEGPPLPRSQQAPLIIKRPPTKSSPTPISQQPVDVRQQLMREIEKRAEKLSAETPEPGLTHDWEEDEPEVTIEKTGDMPSPDEAGTKFEKGVQPLEEPNPSSVPPAPDINDVPSISQSPSTIPATALAAEETKERPQITTGSSQQTEEEWKAAKKQAQTDLEKALAARRQALTGNDAQDIDDVESEWGE